MNYVLRTFKLSKSYSGIPAVNNLSMNIKAGEIYGFLGQNGAGKTTTLSMLMGLAKPGSGEIELFGETLSGRNRELYGRIGSIIDYPGFYGNLTACENLDIHKRMMGVQDKQCITKKLELVGLKEATNKKVNKFSLGMKQRLGIARALLHQPELLILDEPTNGLDPMGIKEMRELILSLSREKKVTVLISSHILSEVQQLADTIGIIHRGKLLEEIDYKELQKRNRHYLQLRVSDDRKAAMLLEQGLGIADYRVWEKGVVRIYERLNDASEVNRKMVAAGLEVSEICLKYDSLEDYFIRLTTDNAPDVPENTKPAMGGGRIA